MKVYLAAPYAARDRVRGYAKDLRVAGFTCVSSWVDEDIEITPATTGAASGLDDATVSAHAQDDLEDIATCDALVLFTAAAVGLTPTIHHSGGRHVETGYALGRGKRVVVVGPPENVFHRIASGAVVLAPTWLRAIGALTEIDRELRLDRLQQFQAVTD
jgi:hypothetical protein